MRRLCAVVLLVVAAVWSGRAAQTPTGPDFSGAWTFDQAATVANAAEAKMMPGPILGDGFVAVQSPLSLAFDILVNGQHIKALYALDGSPSKNSSPTAVPNGAPIEVTSRAKWDGRRLLITSTSQSTGRGGMVTVESTRTLWFDDAGRLVIERTGTPKSMVPSSRSVYRRE